MSYNSEAPLNFPNQLDATIGDTQTTAVLKILRLLSQLTENSDGSAELNISNNIVSLGSNLLSNVSSNITSSDQICDVKAINHTFFLRASSVTDGATVSIEGSPNSADWYLLHSVEVKESGNTIILAQGAYHSLRAKVTNYVDGVYSLRSISVQG